MFLPKSDRIGKYSSRNQIGQVNVPPEINLTNYVIYLCRHFNVSTLSMITCLEILEK